MHFVKLLSTLLCVLAVCNFAHAQQAGIACHPGDCCGWYRQYIGDTYWPVQPVAPGTMCKAGGIVAASECTTPCNAPVQPTPPVQPTQKVTVAPTAAPPVQPTQKVTVAPTPAPATPAPTQKVTVAPTPAPTPVPTQKVTVAPTPVPTQKVTVAPTAAPTQKVTVAPTAAPPVQPTQKPITPSTPAPSTSGCKLSDIFSQADFNTLFPHANGGALDNRANQHAIFNYSYLIQAAGQFKDFACKGTVEQRKRELAAFLAHTSQETSGWWAGQPYNWGYYFSTEVDCTNAACTQYCERYDQTYPCAAGKGYFGRGPIQLSWNYNYGQVSKYLYGDDRLLKNPDMMFEENGTAFVTALWFWMTPQNPKPSCHDVMTGGWLGDNQLDINAGRKVGFGMTVNIINGGVECGYATPAQVKNRIGYYTTYSSYLGVAPGDNLECNTMHSY